MAGERLTMQLQRMERVYMENEQRFLEIDQAFSLMQINPQQLLTLHSTGACTVTLPEFMFDLTYPGHYYRRIKSVRLTIPCITGPYTNVGVTLTLLSSKIRMEANVDQELVAVPRAKNDTVATSTAQNDGGQFTLDFNGARYLPFEGAGAVESEWKIEMPDKFRAFDYQTIADVILHISYTAKDGISREKVNEKLTNQFQTAAQSGLHRIISLQQEFSSEFHRLLHRPLGEEMIIELKRRHFPLFLQDADKIIINSAQLFLQTKEKDIKIENLKLMVNATEMTGFDQFPSSEMTGDIYKASLNIPEDQELSDSQDTVQISISVVDPGSLGTADGQQLSDELLKDMVLLIDYRATI